MKELSKMEEILNTLEPVLREIAKEVREIEDIRLKWSVLMSVIHMLLEKCEVSPAEAVMILENVKLRIFLLPRI